jgi:dTDP-4-amino-4,6-dideoxygalactose transaminase
MPERLAAREGGAAANVGTLPVYRPRLPSAAAILPYLETLDETRRYSNHGPLQQELGARLSRLFGSQEPIVATAGSGTMALIGAILGKAGRADRRRPLCLCPAYTFIATAAAIELCGFELHLVDVDERSWSADPGRLLSHPALSRVGLVVPVAPYGRALPQNEWRRFELLTGIPVVIDGAASLEKLADDLSAHVGPIPVALSFHATKVFATGEGGAVVTTDPGLLFRSIQALNFGFLGVRRSDCSGTNGKMSEYHAAVGLAELDGWRRKKVEFAHVAALYRRVADRLGLGRRLITAPDVASCYALYEAESSAEARLVAEALTANAIEHRHWYGGGLHRQPSLAAATRDLLEGAEDLAARLLGLPMAPDLAVADVERVLATIAAQKVAVATPLPKEG